MTTTAQKLNRTAGATAHLRTRSAAASEAAVVAPTAVRLNTGLGLLRLIVGTVFAAHGAQKLFVFGMAGVAGAFEGMGVPLAAVTGPAVALVEFFGGLALIAGLFTRATASALALVMLGASLLVHLPAGFFLPNGVEFTLALFGVAAGLALIGPGAYSLDALIARRRGQA